MRRSIARTRAVVDSSPLIPPLARIVADYDDITELEKLAIVLATGEVSSPSGLVIVSRNARLGYVINDVSRPDEIKGDLPGLLRLCDTHPRAPIVIEIKARIAAV